MTIQYWSSARGVWVCGCVGVGGGVGTTLAY